MEQTRRTDQELHTANLPTRTTRSTPLQRRDNPRRRAHPPQTLSPEKHNRHLGHPRQRRKPPPRDHLPRTIQPSKTDFLRGTLLLRKQDRKIQTRRQNQRRHLHPKQPNQRTLGRSLGTRRQHQQTLPGQRPRASHRRPSI